MTDADAHVLKDVSDDGVMTLTLNRPDKKNALTQAMYLSVADALAEADEDSGRVGAVLLLGAGGVFTGGNDLKDFLASGGLQAKTSAAAVLLRRLIAVDAPLVIAVDGPAIGIGVTILLHCEFAVAGPSAQFRTPFIDLAACPEGGSSLLMAQRIGRAAANRMLLLGDALGAGEALECGLVDQIDADPGAAGRRLAARLAEKPRGAMRAAKSLLRAGREPQLSACLEREFDAFDARLRSPEAQAAVAKFFAKG